MSTTRVMAALKWRLVTNTVRRSGGKAWAFLTVLVSVAGAAGGFAWMATVGSDPTYQFTSAVIACSGLFFAWLLGSVFILGVDETLDPARLALLPLSSKELRNGFLVTSVIGPAPAAVLVALTGVIVGYRTSSIAMVAVLLAPPTMFVMSVGVSRATATALTIAQRSRKGRDSAVALGAFAAVVFAAMGQVANDAGNREAMARILQWTPPGWVGRSLFNAVQGNTVEALAWIVPAMGFAVLVVVAWFRLLEQLLSETGGAVHAAPISESRRIGVLNGSRTGGPVQAVVAKELRYQNRSPHRRSGVVVGVVVGGGFIIGQAALRGDPGANAVFSAPIATLFMAGSANNQLGFDAGSFWLEVTSGVRARHLFTGRNIVWGTSLLVPALLAGIGLAILGGGWKYIPLMMAATAVLIPVVVGVGSMASVLAPFPVPENASPFGNREALSGRGLAVGLVGLASLIVTVGLMLPGIGAIALVVDKSVLVQIPVLLIVAVVSLGMWWVLLGRAAKRVENRGPELLAALDLRSIG